MHQIRIKKRLKMKVNATPTGQSNVDIGGAFAEPRHAGHAGDNGLHRFGNHRAFDTSAGQRSDKQAILGNRHMRARFPHRRARGINQGHKRHPPAPRQAIRQKSKDIALVQCTPDDRL